MNTLHKKRNLSFKFCLIFSYFIKHKTLNSKEQIIRVLDISYRDHMLIKKIETSE